VWLLLVVADEPGIEIGLWLVDRAMLAQMGLSLDTWGVLSAVPEFAEFARAVPDLTIILNHLWRPETDRLLRQSGRAGAGGLQAASPNRFRGIGHTVTRDPHPEIEKPGKTRVCWPPPNTEPGRGPFQVRRDPRLRGRHTAFLTLSQALNLFAVTMP
jgi:hypothetical protein